jgi:hypothetical protein
MVEKGRLFYSTDELCGLKHSFLVYLHLCVSDGASGVHEAFVSCEDIVGATVFPQDLMGQSESRGQKGQNHQS